MDPRHWQPGAGGSGEVVKSSGTSYIFLKVESVDCHEVCDKETLTGYI